ncbi:hypothetical protein C5D25_03210 [Rathayibacter sp. AY1D7]|nr:hypothetical protein C5D25_03210 [Rathayibacter sp. AY1D7]
MLSNVTSADGKAPFKSVFVISPIGKVGSDLHRKHLQTLTYVIKKALPSPDFDVLRADDESSPDSITGAVIRRIHDSDLIVADLTGHNPNVFYELAVAHGYGKPTIHLLEEGETMPFDIADQRAIFYDLKNPASGDAAIESIAQAREYLEGKPDGYQNPLTSISRFETIASGSSGNDAGEQVALALEGLGERLGRMERALQSSASPENAQADAVARASTLTRWISEFIQNESLLASAKTDDERLKYKSRSRTLRRRLGGMGVDLDSDEVQTVGGLRFSLRPIDAADPTD